MKGTNGYTIVVVALLPKKISSFPRRRFPTEVLVGAGHPGGRVVYSTTGTVSAYELAVDLGAAGEINVRYVRNGRIGRARSRCAPAPSKFPPIYFDDGSYVGTVKIRGEEGFTRASATRVKGDAGFQLPCSHVVGEGTPGPGVLLDTGNGNEGFSAVQNKPGGRVLFGASVAEQHGALSVFRQVLASSGPQSLVTDRHLTTARVEPPAPFSGSGTFLRKEHAHGSWLGDLTVDFPGRAGVPLAGPSFEATLIRGFRERAR